MTPGGTCFFSVDVRPCDVVVRSSYPRGNAVDILICTADISTAVPGSTYTYEYQVLFTLYTLVPCMLVSYVCTAVPANCHLKARKTEDLGLVF